MAQFFYDNEKEGWGGILANMVGLLEQCLFLGQCRIVLKLKKIGKVLKGQEGMLDSCCQFGTLLFKRSCVS